MSVACESHTASRRFRSGPPPRVLRILGHGRSGSTALGALVGGRPGALFAGEVGQAWNAFSHPEWQCGCGDPIIECPFWTAVRVAAFGNEPPDFERLAAIARERVRLRVGAIARLRRPYPRAAVQESDYLDGLRLVYEGIRAASGAELIVDSSSSAPGALLAASLPGIELLGLQLVRDPRAVAHSESSPVERLPGHGEAVAGSTPLSTALRWQARNVLSELMVRRRLAGYARIRYEDFSRDPRGALTLVAELTSLDSLRWSEEREPYILLEDKHAIDGNPRLLARTGEQPIEADERWRREMPRARRRLVSLAAQPTAAIYGYAGCGGGARAAGRPAHRRRSRPQRC